MNEKKKIEVDLYQLIKLAIDDKKKLMAWCVAFAVVGLVYAFTVPRIYRSSVTLAPESSVGGSLTSGISSLASMVGVNLEMGGGYDAIYPEIYPDLMGSKDFQVDMFDTEVSSLDGQLQTTYYNYLDKCQKHSWMTYPFRALEGLLVKMMSSSGKGVAASDTINPKRLTKRQFDIAGAVGKNIKCAVDRKTSVITITATAQDPLISTQLADSAMNRLQYFITRYRTNKARNDMLYMEQLFREAKADYTAARQRYASFSDANQDLLLATYRAKQDELENEMQLKYNIYTQVTEQLQLTRAKVQERTPAFTVIQSASVPYRHSNKSKLSTLIMAIFLAVLFRMSYLCVKHYKEIIHLNLD